MSINAVRGESTGCVRLLQSEACISMKHSGIIILTALAAIGLVAGVLLAMAQQGHDLAGINSLAQMVPQQWLYLGLTLAGTAFVLASIFAAAQVANHLRPY